MSETLATTVLSAMLTSLWMGTLVAVAVMVLFRVVPVGARGRYRVWCVVLAITLLAPAVRISHQPSESPRTALAASPGADHAPAREGQSQAAEVSVAATSQGPAASTSESESGSTAEGPPLAAGRSQPINLEGTTVRLAIGVWLAGAIAGVTWLILQLAGLATLKRAASIPPGDLRAIWLETVAVTRARRRVSLLLSSRTQLPAACGYFHPAVIAPRDLCTALSREETRHLLLHELAHLDRYDDWSLLGHRIIQAVCWWHPVVWLVGRRLEVERELACDEVVAEQVNRRGYARTLVHVAEFTVTRAVPLAPGALRGDLTRRVESLLHRGKLVISPVAKVRAAAATASLVVGALWLSPPAIQVETNPKTAASGVTLPFAVLGGHLDSVFTSYSDSGFSGTILVALGDSVVLEKGYGLADRERGIPATSLTRYSVAGFTKLFTAAAVLSLEEEGLLKVTDSIGRFLGPLPGTAGDVTLHQLLTHTDGLTRHNAPVYRPSANAFVRAVVESPDSFPPGQGYRYNDFGHSLLGVVIERATAQPYESYLRRRFLEPAGLSRTGFENDGASVAIEYAGRAGAQYPIPPRSYTWGRRASLGLVSTAGDIYRWFRAMADPAILPTRARARMLQPYVGTDWGAEQGYGWDFHRNSDGRLLWRRVAGTPGFEGELLHDPEHGWTAVILVNSRVGWRFRIWREIDGAVKHARVP